ncbi:MAG TPA: hypothetical protein VIY29_14765, partial [Ktedonobacteraceae bacterium]
AVPYQQPQQNRPPSYDRSMLYTVSSMGGNGGNNGNVPVRQQPAQQQQGYGSLPLTPSPVNMTNHPTDPVRVNYAVQAEPIMRQRPVVSPAQEPVRQSIARDVRDMRDVSADVYDLDEDPMELPRTGTGSASHGRLPVPEPEAQPSQRPSSDQRPQRPVRRLDLPRGNRNAPSGDVIDIPAFLRKR